ncbi:hypothetical protein SynPROS71_00296 [Synechococcus sp. PROS-7-1]|nr:hypothetical protein SynPROS71_00296 [Synechococcus sp. PROS-7-1]
MQHYVEKGLEAPTPSTAAQRSARQLPRLEGHLAIDSSRMSNAALFELLEP